MGIRNSSLVLFLAGLPANATTDTVVKFVRQGLSDAGYRGIALAVAVPRCSLLRYTDPSSGTSELHAMVEIKPAKAALDALDRLRGREFLGERIEVRRYVNRARTGTRGDQREFRPDRRRKGLRIELVGSR